MLIKQMDTSLSGTGQESYTRTHENNEVEQYTTNAGGLHNHVVVYYVQNKSPIATEYYELQRCGD